MFVFKFNNVFHPKSISLFKATFTDLYKNKFHDKNEESTRHLISPTIPKILNANE